MRILAGLFVVAALVPFTLAGQGRGAASAPGGAPGTPIYLDPCQPLDRRVDDLLSKLTPAETWPPRWM